MATNRLPICALLLFLASSLFLHAQTPTADMPANPPIVPAEIPAALKAVQQADALYRKGDFAAAENAYQAILSTDAKQFHARAGLMRTKLELNKVDEALDLGKAGQELPGATAELVAAMGDVYFRLGEMPDAERAYIRAKQMNRLEMRAWLGLAQLYDSYSLYRHAYDQLNEAHRLAPDSPEVQREWFGRLPRRERLQALLEYLGKPHPDSAEVTMGMNLYVNYLKKTLDEPAHRCHQVNRLEKTQTPLELLLEDATHVRGYGLKVKLNGQTNRLMVDTGASGILLGSAAARRAGLQEVSRISIGGVGDKGRQGGYVAVAKSIRIGDMEFADCEVSVTDKRSVIGDDGLIGLDVFSSYLVDMDMPERTLRLSPLPKREGDPTGPATLNTDEDSSREMAQSADDSGTAIALPRDRYVAPEMKDWTKVFRFGHQLLMPTWANEKRMLFLLDTGSSASMISTRAARQVTKVSSNDMVRVTGLNGNVENVYSADKIMLQFNHFKQRNLGLLTIDLAGISRHTGTEVSGLLGFSLLRMMDMKIDYRDGLVDFHYNPHIEITH